MITGIGVAVRADPAPTPAPAQWAAAGAAATTAAAARIEIGVLARRIAPSALTGGEARAASRLSPALLLRGDVGDVDRGVLAGVLVDARLEHPHGDARAGADAVPARDGRVHDRRRACD